jgi:hypothetical protein
MPEFEQWQSATPDWQKWKCKYYKGFFPNNSSKKQILFFQTNSQVWVHRQLRKQKNIFLIWNVIVFYLNTNP